MHPKADLVANESTKAKPLSHEQDSWWKFWSKTPVITKVGLVIPSFHYTRYDLNTKTLQEVVSSL